MASPTPSSLADAIAAAQAWWREAGVDLAYQDEPRTWLAPERTEERVETRPAPAAVSEKQHIGGDRGGWPGDLASFRQWWLEEPSLDPGGTRGRLAPRGPARAPLMVLVPMPEAEDRDALLSGPQGRLLGNMVRAMGFAAEAIYFAAALPRHTPSADWGAIVDAGMGQVLRHHLELAAPQRLLVLGRDVLPLLGHDLAQAAPAVSELSIQSGKLPLLSSYAPGRLLEHPRPRSELWRRWLDWTGTGE